MGRPKKTAPKHIEPEFESQEIPEEEPAQASTTDDSPDVSKAEAVRIALAEGIELPGDIAEFILKKFGHDMSKQTVSSYKAQEKARQAKKAAAAPAPPRRGRPPQSESASKSASSKPANGELIDDIVAVKQLVEKMGAGQVRKLIDLFG